MLAKKGYRISFVNFKAKLEARPFPDVACGEFSILYEKHMYERLGRLYANVGS